MEKKLRAKLEEELNILRHGEETNSSNARENGENTEQLRQKLSLFEEKVCHLISLVSFTISILEFSQLRSSDWSPRELSGNKDTWRSQQCDKLL